MSGDVEELDGTEKNTLRIFKSITLIHEVGMVLLEVRRQPVYIIMISQITFSELFRIFNI